MQMYPKKITDIDALQRERFRLKVQIQAMEEQGLLEGDRDASSSSVEDMLSWVGPVLGGKSWLNWAVPLAAPLLSSATRGARRRIGWKWAGQAAIVGGLWLGLRFLKKKITKKKGND